MKPISVTMSAFGPFCDEVEVRFDKFNNGIFLITGDTGSGKTTIFDAICFALYGKASGGDERRNVKSFRSDYAKSDTPTFVKFVFSHKGIEYSIKRNPEYERPSKRGENLTKEKAGVILNGSDGLVLDRDSEISKKINEIIGLDFPQFSQTVMIPQNDFMKIINSKSDDRIKLFNKLFHTDRFKKMQEYLANENKRCDSNKKRLESLILADYNKIQYDNNYINVNDLKEVAKDLTRIDDVIILLSYMNNYSKTKLNKVEGDLKGISKENENLIERISLANEINSNFDNLEKYQNEKEALIGQLYDINKKREKLTKAKKALAIEKDNLILDNKKKEHVKLLDELTNNKNELHLKKTELSVLSISKEQIENDYNNIDNINKELDVLASAIGLLTDYKEQEKERKEMKKTLDKEHELFVASERLYIDMREKFFNHQYGIIAKTLVEGKSCPVCGSIHHPNPAALEGDFDLTRKDIEQLEKKKDEAKTTFESTSVKYSAILDNIGAIKKELDDINIDCDSKISDINKKIYENKDFILKATERYEAFNTKYLEITTSVNSLEKNIEAKESELSIIESESKDLEAELNQKIIDNGFTDYNEYASSIIGYDEVEELEKDVNSFDQQYINCNTLINEYQQKVTDRSRIDITLYNETKAYNDEAIGQLENEKTELINTISINKSLLRSIKENSTELKETNEEYALINDLYNCISGNMSGEAKISFEAYVLRHYFKQVIFEANRRLNIISNGEFTLRLKEEGASLKTKTGLDLEVFDRNTGKWRDVTTLSGGESFIASLSLALGLSDFVQARSGVIRLDAMFIDEGFGTLDDDALNQAIRVLQDLSDGKVLVGIISHVSELKNKISQQIIVEKSQMGSKVKIAID